jgi:hypothetical protein
MDAEQAKWKPTEAYSAQTRPLIARDAEQDGRRHEVCDDRLAPASGMILGLLLGALCWACLITAIVFLR